MVKVKVILKYNNSVFFLTTENGVNLWHGRYATLTEALEFARGYMSNLQATELVYEEDLEKKFYEDKMSRNLKFLFGD
jgi:hypothetical protein